MEDGRDEEERRKKGKKARRGWEGGGSGEGDTMRIGQHGTGPDRKGMDEENEMERKEERGEVG